MNQKDYQKGYQYIEQFYQKQGQMSSSDNTGKAGEVCEDLPRSVTDESSFYVDDKRRKMTNGGQTLADELAVK